MTQNADLGRRYPSGRGMSWSNVAHILAERLAHQKPICGHAEAVPKVCPFCADEDAMRVYREKCGASPNDSFRAEE
jgi:hypothetical protein